MKQLEITPELKKLDSVFSKNNYEIRVIGGVVRDLALDKSPKDIDLATDATPQEMQKMFDDVGIKHIPTGIEHGTITAVLNGEPFEITTLRADTETDGRRAEVEFIRSWEEDAKRRDLTYNAMSMDFEGNLYDYHGGMDDLQDKVTRFVGDPAERIKEDYLRTLRYFRFQGRLDTPTFDRDTINAIASNTDGLKQLSVERVWMEMSKILSGENIKQILNAMQKAGVLDAIGLKYKPSNDLMDGGDPIINLARITDDESISLRFKMSNEEKGKLGFLIGEKGKTHDKKWYTDQMVDGFDRTQLDALARYNNQDDMIQYIKTFKAPEFPVDGNDLIKLGHARGPGIGKTLMALRNQWKAGNFKATKDDLLGEDQEFNELDYVLKKQVKPSEAVMLTKLGKFHNGADELEQFVPERKGKQYALHPKNWKGTYYSLTNKDTTKIGYYRPKIVTPPAGSMVADMAIANKFYRTKDEDEKQQLAQAYKDSMVEYGGDISHIKFPEILMPSVNENLQEDTKMPTVSLKDLFHVGTLDASKKGDFSYEGAGLSVTTEPDAWRRIARGQVAGDTHSVAKANNSFLDSHKLTPQHNEQIKQWAIDNGFLEQKETVTVSWYDDEMDDTLSQTFNSMADAEAEHGEYMDDYDVDVDKGGIVPTAKLQKATGQSRIEATGVLEYVLPLYAETLGLDGVWWADDLDVNRLSAPRGVIVPSKVDSFKFNRMNEAAGVGKITKQNTTVDVKPGETERQAKKYFGGTGKPKKLVSSNVMKNSTPNKLYNLGLAEDKEKQNLKGFDPKTAKAINNLMIKFPQAKDPLSAIIADIEDSQEISKAEDKHHKLRNVQQDKQIGDLTSRIEKLEQQRKAPEPVAEDDEMSVIERAELFAQQAHKNHKRKYTGDPYYVHLDEVRRIVKTAGGSEDMQAAALLHDTVEDTSTTSQDIMQEFGPSIARLVIDLTDISKPEDGNRATRKAMDRDKLAMASADAQTIKYADLISNGRDIGQNDPKFAKVYHKEKAELLRVMRKGNKNLRNAAIDMLPDELRTIATENLSYTGTERRRLEKKKGIEVGTPEWFKHWFDLPYLREGDNITYDELVNKAKYKSSIPYYINNMLRTLHSLVTTGGNKHSIGFYAQEVGRQFGFSGRDLEKMYRKEYDTPETGLYKRFSESTIQKVDIKQLETFADKLFGKVGIDVEFTKHFMDRVNDVRNQKPITISELTRLFKQEYKRWGKPIAQMGPNAEAVMKDLQTDINLPFVLKWDSENDELDLVAKTVMRKADFKTPDREFPVENLSEKKYTINNKEIEALIRKYAVKHGIDPETAIIVYRTEGKGDSYQSTIQPKEGSKVKTVNGREASFGPYQLYTGGGLGNDYEKKYDVKLKDDNTAQGIERQIDFALNNAATSGKGWKPWYGPKNAIKDWNPMTGIPTKDKGTYVPPIGALTVPLAKPKTGTIPKYRSASTLRPKARPEPEVGMPLKAPGTFDFDTPQPKPIPKLPVTYNDLAAASGIADPNKIFPGQNINFPDGSTYTIKSGDTLSGIASKYNKKIGENVPATNQAGTIGQHINWAGKNKTQQNKKVSTRGTQDPQSWWQSVLAKGKSLFDDEQMENFADGKKKGKSRPGRVKRAGASCNGSVTSLRKKAKNASGEKAKMYHWCANMKSGRKKTK